MHIQWLETKPRCTFNLKEVEIKNNPVSNNTNNNLVLYGQVILSTFG